MCAITFIGQCTFGIAYEVNYLFFMMYFFWPTLSNCTTKFWRFFLSHKVRDLHHPNCNGADEQQQFPLFFIKSILIFRDLWKFLIVILCEILVGLSVKGIHVTFISWSYHLIACLTTCIPSLKWDLPMLFLAWRAGAFKLNIPNILFSD